MSINFQGKNDGKGIPFRSRNFVLLTPFHSVHLLRNSHSFTPFFRFVPLFFWFNVWTVCAMPLIPLRSFAYSASLIPNVHPLRSFTPFIRSTSFAHSFRSFTYFFSYCSSKKMVLPWKDDILVCCFYTNIL